MKKTIIILLVLALVLPLWACRSASSIYVGDDISVGLIIAERGDRAFNDAAIVGLNMAQNDYDINLNIYEHQNRADKFTPLVEQAAQAGNQIIMASSLLTQTIEACADRYPEQIFVLFDGELDWSKGKFANVVCLSYKTSEAAFLAGFMGAKLSKTGLLGVLAGLDIPANNDFIVGYIQGALKADPEVKLVVDYLGNFSDSDQARELARSQIDRGADLILAVAGGANHGVFSLAAETGVRVIGVDTDQAMLYQSEGQDQIAQVIVSSVLKRVDRSLYEVVGLYLDQDLDCQKTYLLGLADEAVGLAKNQIYEQSVDPAIQSQLDSLAGEIIAGDLRVKSAWREGREFVQDLINSVEP